MHIPDAATLLQWYYGTQIAIPAIASGGMLVFLVVALAATNYGFKRGVRYTWRVGIPHTQKEYEKLYRTYKAKLGEQD